MNSRLLSIRVDGISFYRNSAQRCGGSLWPDRRGRIPPSGIRSHPWVNIIHVHSSRGFQSFRCRGMIFIGIHEKFTIFLPRTSTTACRFVPPMGYRGCGRVSLFCSMEPSIKLSFTPSSRISSTHCFSLASFRRRISSLLNKLAEKV